MSTSADHEDPPPAARGAGPRELQCLSGFNLIAGSRAVGYRFPLNPGKWQRRNIRWIQRRQC